MTVIIESHYAPCIRYFQLLLSAKKIIIDDCGLYKKQSYGNRCYLLDSQGIHLLTVPIEKKIKKTLFKDIRIYNSSLWYRKHLMTISTAYGRSPFFEHYFSVFQKIYSTKHLFLIDFNFDLLLAFFSLLNISIPICLSSESSIDSFDEGYICDYRGIIEVRGGSKYNNILFMEFKPYTQVFNNEFISNLSIIDLIMCEGPYAIKYISKTI